MVSLFVAPPERCDPDERFTPAWLFHALGEEFDLDPACPVEGGDHVPAARKLTRNEDGLSVDWAGFVWLNPPFSSAAPWAARFIAHHDGLWLGPVSNSRWFITLARSCDALYHVLDFPFDHPAHAGRYSSMPLAMCAMGDRACVALARIHGLSTRGALMHPASVSGA